MAILHLWLGSIFCMIGTILMADYVKEATQVAINDRFERFSELIIFDYWIKRREH